jgi:hypothetical protein
MYVALFVGRDSKGLSVGYEALYSGAPSDGERLLAPLQKLGKPLYDDVALKTYVAAQGAAGKESAAPSKKVIYFRSGFIGGRSTDWIDEVVRRFESSPPIVKSVLLFRQGGAAGRVKPDATAFWNRWMNYSMLLVASWDDRSYNEENLRAARIFWGALEPLTRNYYINTDVNEDERRLRATYGDNHPRLVKLKDKYDPTNLFRLNANIKPTSQG